MSEPLTLRNLRLAAKENPGAAYLCCFSPTLEAQVMDLPNMIPAAYYKSEPPARNEFGKVDLFRFIQDEDLSPGEWSLREVAPAGAETWQEEMARWKRDPEALRRRKEEGAAVGRLLREEGVDLPIVLPNLHYPVGEQVGREARIREEK